MAGPIRVAGYVTRSGAVHRATTRLPIRLPKGVTVVRPNTVRLYRGVVAGRASRRPGGEWFGTQRAQAEMYGRIHAGPGERYTIFHVDLPARTVKRLAGSQDPVVQVFLPTHIAGLKRPL